MIFSSSWFWVLVQAVDLRVFLVGPYDIEFQLYRTPLPGTVGG